jgi:Flp pilus assembly protein TadG
MRRLDADLCQKRIRRAATAFEFAVILPVLLTMVLGCVDFGRFAHSYIVVTNAARVGASYGIVNPYTPETYTLWQNGVQKAITQEMMGLSQFDAQSLKVQTTVISGTDSNWSVQVQVGYPFHTLIPWPGIPSLLDLQQAVVMQTIRP